MGRVDASGGAKWDMCVEGVYCNGGGCACMCGKGLYGVRDGCEVGLADVWCGNGISVRWAGGVEKVFRRLYTARVL
jgi:hypothetical protein